MKKAVLIRIDEDAKQSLGHLSIYNGVDISLACVTLELPNNNNETGISRIPAGFYKVVPRTSQKFGKHFIVLDVPGRQYILFHAGNYHSQIKGCILVGQAFNDINNDGYLDVVRSKETMEKLIAAAPKGFWLKIMDFAYKTK